MMSRPDSKPKVIGLYGIDGSGKSYLMTQLQKTLDASSFSFIEGSEFIDELTQGGLEAFKKLPHDQKQQVRERVIEHIAAETTKSGTTAVLTGHFMFWNDAQTEGEMAWTEADAATMTHIVYLDVPVSVIAQRRQNDQERTRGALSVEHLQKWKDEEIRQLRKRCRDAGILFTLVSHDPMLDRVVTLLQDFHDHDERSNFIETHSKFDAVMGMYASPDFRTMLAFDADKTLSADDTGKMFWKETRLPGMTQEDGDPLKALFSSQMGYSYKAFRQAALLYEEVADDDEFERHCEKLAQEVKMHPEFVSLIGQIEQHKHVAAVVLTCGLSRVWQKVLEKAGLSCVPVIGGVRLKDGFVVTPQVKGALVDRLRHAYKLHVVAFGDSPVDMDMLRNANEAVIVVGHGFNRSRSMEKALQDAIGKGFKARQALLPAHSSPKASAINLPVVKIDDEHFIQSIANPTAQTLGLQVHHATDKAAALLLATPTRDAASSGPVLREAHRRVGWYLAMEYVSELIGLESCPIRHVTNKDTYGSRLAGEGKTTIVALMRGGEPMAYGVSEAFPLAMFLHANEPDDLKAEYVKGQQTIVLVDSVVNTGKTIVQFVEHTRSMSSEIRIVVVTGVGPKPNISEGGDLAQQLATLGLDKNICLVALRSSDSQYVGKGVTDTGNRLFSTTHLA